MSDSTWDGELPDGLHALQQQFPVLLIFLRHFGCTFCREALADVVDSRVAIEATGARVAFVHMSPRDEADAWFAWYGMSDVLQISDPDKQLYRQFGLTDASLGTLVQPAVLASWFRTAVVEGHGFGAAGPNWRQLTGTFVIFRGRILTALRYDTSAVRPDYLAIVRAIDHATMA